VQEYGLLALGDGQWVDGIVLNAGGYTHTSVALRDAVACSRVPVVEVHVSDIMQREAFRHISLLTDVCAHSVLGQGTDGYRQAIEWIVNRKTEHTNEQTISTNIIYAIAATATDGGTNGECTA
jgi:3-dehydroquinate dehydratase